MKRLKNKKMVSALRLLLLILCGLVLGVNVYLLNANSLVGNQLPMPFGYGAAVVLSGSMEPVFSAGDLIVVKDTDNFELKDIVVFQDGNSLVIHRIVEMELNVEQFDHEHDQEAGNDTDDSRTGGVNSVAARGDTDESGERGVDTH